MQWIKKTNSFLSVLLFAFAHFVRAPFDPNMHHDGLMYTAAVAASKGLIPHRDYFSQYGPLTPIIHGWWLAATDRTLLSLRFFNALLLTLISILLFVILRRHLSFLTAFLLVSIWSFSSPEILPADLPWPSVISTLLLMIAITIIGSKSQNRLASVQLFLVGTLIGMSFFVRIHNLIIPIIIVFLFTINRLAIRQSFPLLLGVSISSLTFIFWLTVNGALGDFIQQVILWPLRGHAGSTYGTKALIVNFLLLLQIPFFLFVAILVLRNTKSNRSIFSFLLFLTLFLVYLYGRLIPNIPVNERSFRNPLYLSEFLGMQSRQLFNFAAIGLFALILFRWKQFNLVLDIRHSVLLGLTLGALTQLYPSPDAYHVWWIAPVFIAAVGILWQTPKIKTLYPLMGAVLAVNIVHTAVQVDVNRQKYSSSVLKGMYGNEVTVDLALQALEEKVGLGSTKFDCVDGIYAANPNGYLANSALYVNWKIGILDGSAERAEFFVTCNPDAVSNPSDKELIWRNPVLSIYQNR